MKRSNSKNCFSLVELMVVFAVLGILFTLLSARLNKITQYSQIHHCQTNLKTVFLGVNLFSQDNDSKLPGPLLAGQFPSVRKNFIAGYISPYVETKRRSDNRANIVQAMMCPSNESKDNVRADDLRLHYRTHIGQNSTTYFGYPNRRDPTSVFSIASPSQFDFLRDISKAEFTDPNRRLPGWYDLLAEAPPHFGTDVNVLKMDGSIEPRNMFSY